MEKVTHLFLITDPSRKGCKVVDTIKEVADELVMYDKCGVIVNRVKEESIPHIQIESAEVLAYIPDDRTHAENDIMGVSVFDLPEDSPVMVGTREALRKMQLI
jgi:CO dehydrogenase maturation factor